MRILIIGGGHAAYFVINTLREVDKAGKIIVVEFTREKVEVLSKTFPFAEVLVKSIDEVEQYIRGNSMILDAIIASTESDALNLRYAKAAHENGIPLTIAVLNNPLNAEIFKKEGIRYLINPFASIPTRVKEILGVFETNVIHESAINRISIYAVRMKKEEDLRKIGKHLGENGLAYLYVAVDGSIEMHLERFEMGGTLYLMGEKEKVKNILRKLGKEAR